MSGFSRREFNATAAGFAVGLFATSRLGASAQEGTPDSALEPKGFVSTRIRTVESAEQRETVTGMVLNGFVRDIQALDGYRGYVLGDVVDQPEQSLSILALENQSQESAFDELAAAFVANVEEEVSTVDTKAWFGDLLIASAADHSSDGAPKKSPGAGPLTKGYIAVRVHTSQPETDPRDVAQLASSDFLPIIEGINGFRGYLWYPTDAGFVAVSVFDSEDAATESNEVAKDWAGEFLSEYTDGEPEIINANIRFASLPVLR